MAYATVYLSNGKEIKKAPVGYSWTVLFWGCFPPFMRQDWLWGFGILIAGMVTCGAVGIIASFFYNKVYIKALVDEGYSITSFENITEDDLRNYLGYVTLPMKK